MQINPETDRVALRRAEIKRVDEQFGTITIRDLASLEADRLSADGQPEAQKMVIYLRRLILAAIELENEIRGSVRAQQELAQQEGRGS